MKFCCFRPRDDISEFVSCYYSVSFDEGMSDVMRAEIANVRFLVKGSLTTDVSGETMEFSARSALLCGPTHQASNITFSKGCYGFRAEVTPLGWARLFDVERHDLAD